MPGPELEPFPLSVISTSSQFKIEVGALATTIGKSTSTSTSAVASEVQPFWPVITTVYVPPSVVVGFCCVEVKLLGPDQLYVTFGARRRGVKLSSIINTVNRVATGRGFRLVEIFENERSVECSTAIIGRSNGKNIATTLVD